MPLETAQLLCSFFEPGTAPYKRTHYNHPCGVWARTSQENAMWLIEHGLALGTEYTRRYGKRHKSVDVIYWCLENLPAAGLPSVGLTAFAQAMPDEYRNEDPVVAYRNYYKGAKARIATWKTPAGPPEWWHKES